MTPTDTSGLAARLREETRAEHRAAERGALVHALLRGQLTRERYAAYLRALWPIYDALESGLRRHAAHPVVGPLALPGLERGPAIAADLFTRFGLTLGGAPAVPAATAYAERLIRLADVAPSLLVAHAYTRYLGDLSGGQILRRGAARILALSPDPPPGTPGLAFYDFPEIVDLERCKEDIRARLDALPIDAAQATAIVAEARWAFAGTAAVFAALLPEIAVVGPSDYLRAPWEPAPEMSSPPQGSTLLAPAP